MVGGVPELDEIVGTVGCDIEGVDKDGGNSKVPWYYIQGSGTDIAAVRQKKLDGERGDVEDPGGVLPPVGHTDCGDDGKTCGRQDVGISTSGVGARRVYSKMTGDHRGTGGIPPHI